MPHAESTSAADANMDDSIMSNAPAQALENEGNTQSDTSLPDADTKPAAPKLEDMFDDDDSSSDDEFSSSAPTAPDSSLPPPKAQYSDPNTLRQFYQRLLPFRPLFQWLNHSPTPCPDFQHREFAFTLEGGRYVRYQSFASADLFRKACVSLAPERFEIGPQYSINPRDRKTVLRAGSFRPVMKELVFDIDMTDYDAIRTCCSGANICHKCWAFITMAIRVVDAALRDDFGFQHILWVYSGRRGAHAWVSDKRARELDDQKRRAIANYLVLIQNSEQGKRAGIRRPLHPHLERSLKLLNPYFQSTVLNDQDPWRSPEQAARLLDLLPDKNLTTALQKKWDSSPNRSSAQKWADIDAVAEAGNLSTLSPRQLVDTKQDIRLEYTYPRLDAEVSKKLNHLLKSPFVVHPGTGRVCVPIDVRDLENFDPLGVPTVTECLSQIDEWDRQNKGMGEEERGRVQEWQKTALRPFVEYFRGYVAALMREEGKGKRGREEEGGGEAMEF